MISFKRPSQVFLHCPRCGLHRGEPESVTGPFACKGCAFTFYFNPAVAAAVFIEGADRSVLLIKRAKDPAKGKLAPPGGFVDIGETAETGIVREVREEVGLELADLRFLCSEPNHYFYKEVQYPVLDLFFTAKAIAPETAQALDDVDGFVWVPEKEIVAEDLAFPSMQAAWRLRRDRGNS